MKARFLFPHRFRIIGYFCIIGYIPVMVIKKVLHNGYNNQDPAKKLADSLSVFNSEHIFFAIAMVLITIGLLFIAFAKEKVEDEQILQVRLDSLQWAIYFNYIILMLSIFLVNNFHFRDILFLNLWSSLIFFIIRFRWKIYQNNRLLRKNGDLI